MKWIQIWNRLRSLCRFLNDFMNISKAFYCILIESKWDRIFNKTWFFLCIAFWFPQATLSADLLFTLQAVSACLAPMFVPFSFPPLWNVHLQSYHSPPLSSLAVQFEHEYAFCPTSPSLNVPVTLIITWIVDRGQSMPHNKGEGSSYFSAMLAKRLCRPW